MVKKYRVTKRGIGAGVLLAQQLRVKMQAQMEEFLFHSLIVLIEDYPPDATDTSLLPWHDLVLAAGIGVYTAIHTGTWFYREVGMLVEIQRRQVSLSLYGPTVILDSEFAPLLAQCGDLIEEGEVEGVIGTAYANKCLKAEVLSDSMLHAVISRQTEALEKTGKSYLLTPSFRRHKKLVHVLQGDSSAAD